MIRRKRRRKTKKDIINRKRKDRVVKDASRLKCIPNNWRVLYKSTGGFLPVAYTDFLTIITQIKLATANNIYKAVPLLPADLVKS